VVYERCLFCNAQCPPSPRTNSDVKGGSFRGAIDRVSECRGFLSRRLGLRLFVRVKCIPAAQCGAPHSPAPECQS